MADIQEMILSKYDVDIVNENIFKLYKINSINIDAHELETKISETRKRWNISVNGANERIANRDRLRLEKAEKYEAILRDEKLRKKVFDYYNKNNSKKTADDTQSFDSGSVQFAREYFQIISTTKKLKKDDVEFFFDYYTSEKKKKKDILKMLRKEFKVLGLKDSETKLDEKNTEEIEGKKKDESSPMITNLFQEATVLKLRSVVEKFEEASQNNKLKQKYPKLGRSLYEFLEIEHIKDAKQFAAMISEKRKEVYAVRQEYGAEYVPLVDLFNTLQKISDYKDVVDNIPEFKLLLKYPNLTSYMYSFVDMKPVTINGIAKIANRDYGFRDVTDFILNYYEPVHDNFGISDSGIGSIIRKAKKKSKQNEILNKIDKKLGRNKNNKLPMKVMFIHFLVYWPIFLSYFIFEFIKLIFTNLYKFKIPIFILIVLLTNIILPMVDRIDNLLVLRKIFLGKEWVEYLRVTAEVKNNSIIIFLRSIHQIVKLLTLYFLPAIFCTSLLMDFSSDFNKKTDWIGFERTFKQLLSTLLEKTKKHYNVNKSMFIRRNLIKIFSNILSMLVLIGICYFFL